MDHVGRWLEIFQPDRRESAHLEKMTKSSQKSGFQKWYLEVLGKEILEVNLLGPPRIGKSARNFWRRNLKRGK